MEKLFLSVRAAVSLKQSGEEQHKKFVFAVKTNYLIICREGQTSLYTSGESESLEQTKITLPGGLVESI